MFEHLVPSKKVDQYSLALCGCHWCSYCKINFLPMCSLSKTQNLNCHNLPTMMITTPLDLIFHCPCETHNGGRLPALQMLRP